jgi:hypothetical protein
MWCPSRRLHGGGAWFTAGRVCPLYAARQDTIGSADAPQSMAERVWSWPAVAPEIAVMAQGGLPTPLPSLEQMTGGG